MCIPANECTAILVVADIVKIAVYNAKKANRTKQALWWSRELAQLRRGQWRARCSQVSHGRNPVAKDPPMRLRLGHASIIPTLQQDYTTPLRLANLSIAGKMGQPVVQTIHRDPALLCVATVLTAGSAS